MIKALVADDSGLMRLIITDVLNSDKDIEVIDTASNGKEAAEKTCLLKPDIVVLDMNMGEFDGRYAIQQIMAKCPTPILILSALGNTDLDAVMDALRLGAVDYINKPEKNQTKVRDIGVDIIRKVKSVSRQANKKVLASSKPLVSNTYKHTFPSRLNYDVIVIGASTGGPTAIENVISKFPENLPIPVLIAQHMPQNFVLSFAQRLNTLTPLKVVVGIKDELLEPGHIYIAPGNNNMKVVKTLSHRVKIDYDPKKYKEYNNPSVNSLMISVAEVYGKRAIAVVLTGMGKDGAEGMKAIMEAGGYTIGQNKETSVVYGMPREVIENGYAKQAVPIDEIGGFIVSCLD